MRAAPRGANRRYDAAEDALLREMWLAGAKMDVIALRLGRSQSSLSERRQHLLLPARRRGQRPAEGGEVILPTKRPAPTAHLPGTPGKFEELCRRYAAGEELWSERDARRAV
jgi:hypothetical protein